MAVSNLVAPSSGITVAEVSSVENWEYITHTNTGGVANITFSSIPSGYKKLRIFATNARSANNNFGTLSLRLNNSTSNIYNYTVVRWGANGTSGISTDFAKNSGTDLIRLGINNSATTTHSNYIIEISGNNSTNPLKTVTWWGTLPEMYANAAALVYYDKTFNNAGWTNTNEINRIDLFTLADTWSLSNNGGVYLYGTK